VLLEGFPGVAKTLLVKLIAKTVDVGFKRIQFTPDLMPSDVLGTMVFNQKNSNFSFHKGPIFSNFVLIDEINRSPAKTQAALFEVMEERQVTMEGVTHPLEFPFLVIGTQNPIDQEGTYRLPEAQLDRFVFKIKVPYPTLEEELAILERFKSDFDQSVVETVNVVLNAKKLKECEKFIQDVHIEPQILEYITKVIHATRNHSSLYLGASPRASLAIMRTSKAFAALAGRNYVKPDDVQRACGPVLNHRLIPSATAEMEGFTSVDLLEGILEEIEVPR
jgi:MoxR-like ATPase